MGANQETGMKSSIRYFSIAAVVAGSLAVGSSAWALGFRNPDQSARATAQGEAFVAQADDASAIYYNPAGLTQVKGTQITSGMGLGFPKWEYSGDDGNDEMNTMYMLPHFYASSDFGLQRWRFGLGLNVPFGNAAEYDENGPLQFSVIEARMSVFSITPTVAYQVNDHLSLGVGLNIYYGTTELEQNVPPPPFGPGGRLKFKGDGMTVGATVGALWRINQQHSVGVTYRSPFQIDFEDSAKLTGGFAPTAESTASSTIKFPQSVAVGYAFRPTPKWKLEVDVEWTNWDPLNNVTLSWPGALLDGTQIPFNWEDSFFYEFGTQYQLNDRWALRAGYIFSENSVPDSSYSPSTPDADRHVFSAGVGYQSRRLDVDVTYQYSLSEDRDVVAPGNVAEGHWESSGHQLLITSTWKF